MSPDETAKAAGPEPMAFAPRLTVEPMPSAWSPIKRVGFRMAFIFFFCFIFLYGNGTIFSPIPIVGDFLEHWLTWPTDAFVEWLGQHVFHLTGIAAHWHPTGSGDTTLNWIQNGLFCVYALAGGLVWTGVAVARGNRRLEYRTLDGWLRFGLRLSSGAAMLSYGLAKLFPLQMAPISIAVLNEPLGNSSPMTLLWSLVGMHPAYEMICGAAEAAGGVLLLYRRTTLLGALVSAFVMTNVVLYNFFFDVPVKLFATFLLLACLFLALPDAPALFRFFWQHRPVAPSGVWFPEVRRRGWRIATHTAEWAFVLMFLIVMPMNRAKRWTDAEKAAKGQSALLGAWKLDAGQQVSGPSSSFVTPEGLPATDLYVDTVARAFTRSSDGTLWRTRLAIDERAKTLGVRFFRGTGVDYRWSMPDADHVVMVSHSVKPDPAFHAETLRWTRTPLPSHYPLLDRGFHLVNQWGLER